MSHVSTTVTRNTHAAIQRAAVTSIAELIEASIRSSWLYRWLTAEPEPEVIVIDLRETFSVGPFIDAIDRILRTLVPASHRSWVRDVIEAGLDHLRAAPIRIVSIFVLMAVLVSSLVIWATTELTQATLLGQVLLLALAALGTRVRMPWEEVVETRVVKLLIAALEPPEPPEEFDGRKP